MEGAGNPGSYHYLDTPGIPAQDQDYYGMNSLNTSEDFDLLQYLEDPNNNHSIGAMLEMIKSMGMNDELINPPSSQDGEAEPTKQQQQPLFTYGIPIMIVLGNISNLMALFVLRRKKFANKSTCYYLKAYAVANLCLLNVQMGVSWACHVLDLPDVSHVADWTCGAWMFLTSVINYMGVWLVVAIDIDRLIFLVSKKNAKSHCTLFAAKTVVVIIVIGLVVVSIHCMWTYSLQTHGCFVSYDVNDLHAMTWPYWSAAIYSYIPLVLIVVLNVAKLAQICCRLAATHHRAARCLPCPACICTTPACACCASCVVRIPANRSKEIHEIHPDDFIITTSVISLFFFVTTFPITVTNLIEVHSSPTTFSADSVARVELTKAITELVFICNRAFLGFYLLICSKTFRRESVLTVKAFLKYFKLKKKDKIYELRKISQTDNEDSVPTIQVNYQFCRSSHGLDAVTVL